MKVFVDTPSFFIRPNNTDWRYMRSLKRLSEFIPVTLVYPRDWLGSLSISARYAAGVVKRRLLRMPAPPPTAADYCRELSTRELKASGADVVLSHGPFPVNAAPVPVVWHHCVLDPEMLAAAGRPREAIDTEYVMQQPHFAAAAAVQVATKREVARHAARFPALADRFRAVPFFKPDLKGIPASEVAAKHRKDGVVDILFVGREARRKGLDFLVAAIARLPAPERHRLRLHVVSQMTDGEVALAGDFEIVRHDGLPFARVLQLMAQCPIYAMPSRFESYGLVFIEAMSQGCAVIGPAWECQKDILDDGNAGVNAQSAIESVADAVALLLDPAQRLPRAQAGHQRFHDLYCADVVAAAHRDMFEFAVARGKSPETTAP